MLGDLLSSLLDLFVWIGGLILKPLGAQPALGAAYPVVAVLFGLALMVLVLFGVLSLALSAA